MFKCLTVAGLILGIAHPAQSQIVGDGREKNQPTQRKDGGSAPVAPLPQVQLGSTEQAKESEHKAYQWGELIAPANVPNWFLVGVAFWAGLMAVKTLKAIRIQADLMKIQADLMAVQSQQMIDSERPWIIAHMEQSKMSCLLDNGNVRFTWSVKNVGKSPAKLIEAGARVTLDTLGPPLYPVQYKMESLDERILVPGDSIPLFIFWSIVENGRTRTQVGKTLEEFNDLAIVYGCIRYRGATGTPDIYETRFSESSVIDSGVCKKFEPHWPVNPEDIRCT
jgi:hypothetical protein